MTRQQIVAMALGAVLVFWAVGAYNRVVALRNAIGQAWAKIDEALRQRMLAMEPMLAALRESLASERGALDALQAALAEAAGAAALMGAQPVHESHAAAWAATEAALAAAGSRVFSLLEQNEELGLQPTVEAGIAAWRDASTRLAFARQLFNDAAVDYNEAISLFPTRLLVSPFGFARAGRV
jgi:LemA protein